MASTTAWSTPLGNRDPQLLLYLHEDHALAIAHGYAKATDRAMAVMLHANVGLMHGLLGIFNAWCDRLPVFVMGASGPADACKRRSWIEWIHASKDQGALLRHSVKWDDEPRSPQTLVESMLRAAALMRTPPMSVSTLDCRSSPSTRRSMRWRWENLACSTSW